jgi:hypothetical protein
MRRIYRVEQVRSRIAKRRFEAPSTGGKMSSASHRFAQERDNTAKVVEQRGTELHVVNEP